ncbi:MAG: 30S ribosomal protein S6 [Armatimonadota bacterium]
MEELYEAMLVVEPTKSDEELSATIEQIKALIVNADGQVESAYPAFRRRLAYPVGDHTEGIYVMVYFRGAQAVETLKRDLQMSPDILRLLVVQASKQALWLEGPPAPPESARDTRRGPPAEQPAAAESKGAAPAEAETPTPAEPEAEAAPGEPEAEGAAPAEAETPAPAPAQPEGEAPAEAPQEAGDAEPEESARDAEPPQEDARP